MIQFIIVFTLCSLVNVMLNTMKTIIMYKQDKLSSSCINALTYGFYTVIVVLMAGDMNLWLKIAITAITNFIGVWVSMVVLEKLRKDKLWKIEATIKSKYSRDVVEQLHMMELSFSEIEVNNGDYIVYNIYCATQKDTAKAKIVLENCQAKYFVSESLSL